MTEPFVKRRARATPGSIPDVLRMFTNEVRFYREIAPVVGVRVPVCLEAEVQADGGATLLVLENLSGWTPGADPTAAARALAGMHEHWQGVAHRRPRRCRSSGTTRLPRTERLQVSATPFRPRSARPSFP
ncbi:hypothetical protein [Actinopolymorpha rutila]|uniref:Phosphotransferase enzyme family protein n=1 Tax=Actinopolymorpha rutila TaxID=446787 RepID=A0A852ZPK5_9ACTN|nr:hypothetical protein [Actinopolymorpha rutila]NYH93472.1 hypothetical protein [Actinopolymorpha rutila]